MAKDPTTCRLTKRQVDYYLHLIHRRLRTPDLNIAIKRMKVYDGWTDKEKNILLHPERGLLPTIIHEILHVIYHNKNEQWIEKLERKIVRRITDRQMKNLIIILAEQVGKSKQKHQIVARVPPESP